MKSATVQALAWVLIYGGLLGAGLGLSLQRTLAVPGWALMVAGGVVVLVGVSLVYVRSRMNGGR